MSKATFNRVIKGAAGGLKLEPLLINALYDPQYKPFTIDIRGSIAWE